MCVCVCVGGRGGVLNQHFSRLAVPTKRPWSIVWTLGRDKHCYNTGRRRFPERPAFEAGRIAIPPPHTWSATTDGHRNVVHPRLTRMTETRRPMRMRADSTAAAPAPPKGVVVHQHRGLAGTAPVRRSGRIPRETLLLPRGRKRQTGIALRPAMHHGGELTPYGDMMGYGALHFHKQKYAFL